MSSVFSSENDSWKRARVPELLCVPELLHLLGLLPSGEALPLALEIEGDRFGQVVLAAGSGEWLHAPDARFEPVARWRRRQEERYWFEVLEEERAVYFAYNSCADDPRRPMSAFLDDVLDAFGDGGAERLVIDLRNNSGGNSTVLGNHMDRFRRPELDGRVFALIGPRTYSSGMLNAMQLRNRGATLVGEPTGGKPNSYGEVRSFRLPHSGLKVFYSTKYFRMLEPEDPSAVEPDVVVGSTAEEYFSGEDPVLRRALEAEVR